MSTTLSERTGTARVLALITLIFGVIFVVAGGVTWGAVASNLSAEKITVSPDATFGGQNVNSPWTAFSQAQIIRHHELTASNDKTYSELGAMITAKQNQLKAAGESADQIAKDADVVKLQGQRTTVMNGSFLRASLFTSVIAFGVALFAVGVGVVFALIGWTLMKMTSGAAAVAPVVKEPVTV